MNVFSTRELERLALFTLTLGGLAATADAQYTVSIDWHSPTVGVPDFANGVPITEGDLLVPALGAPALGPLFQPATLISGGFGGLGIPSHPGCVGHPGGTPCGVEVDAFSFGADGLLAQLPPAPPATILFSVDEYAKGTVLPFGTPSVGSESPVGDSSADIFVAAGGLPPGPLPPFAAPVGNVGLVDGDGLVSGSGAAYPGLGLREPNFPGFPNLGDTIDALDHTLPALTSFPAGGVFFSLDGPLPDPNIPGGFNSNSALINGFLPGDVLWTVAPGGPPVVYAPSNVLGLDLLGALDDLDALAVFENGSGAYEPSQQPYDWVNGATDMVLFSVRRGSTVIGAPDSIFGIPIEEGDILTTPLPTIFGGVSPYPGIFIAAENLGLNTARAGFQPDDLNGLDTLDWADCNGNGLADVFDIASGSSTDVNANGVPDECEIIGSPGCFCLAGLAPCGNAFPTAGCRNSIGLGALLTLSGSGSVNLDNLVLLATQLPPNKMGIFFFGTTPVGPLPFGDGLRCAGGALQRTTPGSSGPGGTLSAGPGLATAYGIPAFSTRYFQCWYRDPAGPCASGFNTSNSHSVTFTP